MADKFFLPGALLDRVVNVALVGLGGTGSEMLDSLARIHCALVALGHPGFKVAVIDGDTVSPSNVGRQRFSPHDVGLNKASVLVHRYNLFYGLAWDAVPRFLDNSLPLRGFDVLVTCVDKASVRVALAKRGAREMLPSALWLDCGNGAHDGQVVLGHFSHALGFRLPNVFDLYPELVAVADDAEPSCSFAEAIAQQDLFVNRWTANAAGQLLWSLFRAGFIVHHGFRLDLKSGSVLPLPIGEKVWAFMGYEPKRRKKRKGLSVVSA